MNLSNPRLSTGESLIADRPEELLFRQMTPHLVQNHKPVSHAFGPSDADQGKPSYSRDSIVTAQESRDWHTRNSRSPSLVVWAVSVGEVTLTRTAAIDDSRVALAEGAKRAPGHCFIDLRERDRPEIKRVRALLLRAALLRGEIPTEETPGGDDLTLDVEDVA